MISMTPKLLRNPLARKRFNRFRETRRSYYALILLALLYGVSLFSELICNDKPLYIRLDGESRFPILRFYPEDAFLRNGNLNRPDYHKIRNMPLFRDNPDNRMIFPPVPFGPYTSIDPDSISVCDHIAVIIEPEPLVGNVNIRKDYTIASAAHFGVFINASDDDVAGASLIERIPLTPEIERAIQARFANQADPMREFRTDLPGRPNVHVSLSTYRPRSTAPATVRISFREMDAPAAPMKLRFDPEMRMAADAPKTAVTFWNGLEPEIRGRLTGLAAARLETSVDRREIESNGRLYTVRFDMEEVRFPYPPVKGHPLGIDDIGRDVFARILYGLRTSMTFGLLLVLISYGFGIAAGAFQGYYGGWLDITGQRLIEIWSALPFLYVMILMGAVYGRSFTLLIVCYGMFNWIGISYYIRAEFLRLRRQPFVEAARCMGLSDVNIIFRHILPNALVPVITFFPFSLVGAIGALTALDYLGFGLPPPTPSWGELLFQAQQYRWAWWLILYPSLALFLVMMLGVFVGEGVRQAYDPKRFTRIEG